MLHPAILPPPGEPSETAPTDPVDVLLSRVADAQHEAFAELYDRMAPAVYGIAKQMLRDEAKAEQVTHDAMLEVWSTCRFFDPARGSANAWILSIAHRRAVEAVRSKRPVHDQAARSAPRSGDPPHDLDEMGLPDTFGLLTAVQRHAIQLAYCEAVTYREVAEILDVPVSTVRSEIHNGLRRLGKALPAAGSRAPEARGAGGIPHGHLRPCISR